MADHLDGDDWRSSHLATVIAVFVRAVRDPALAWDLAAETMASAALAWGTFAAGSRLAWVLEHGRRVLRDTASAGRVPCVERTRNNVAAPRTLTVEEQAQVRELGDLPLQLDEDARLVVARLERDAPPPQLLHDLGLSPLTIRGTEQRSRRDG